MREQQHGRRMSPVMAWLFTASLALLPRPGLAGPMDLGGHFAVSESGAATYTIPLQVPPGTAGIEPKLALTYNSQSGNGLLGVGWSLSGLSGITRCPRTMAQDGYRGSVNFDANDRYCLDGQRLMVISGTDGGDGAEYRTERESFSKIVSYGTAGNGPAWFKVWTKGGQILEYGNTADSRIEAVKAPGAVATWPTGTVRAWAQNRLSDTTGNYYTITYTEDAVNGDYYPQRIDYTGNATSGLVPSNSVQFGYELRLDIAPLYQSGSKVKNTVRMNRVQTFGAGSLLGEYRLGYDNNGQGNQSRLGNIVECVSDGNCLAPIQLGYSSVSGVTFGPIGNTPGWGTAAGFSDGNTYPIFTGDWNGDGKTDFARVHYEGIAFFLSNGTGGFTQSGSVPGWGPRGGFIDGNVYPIITGDWNGDGRTDFARVNYEGFVFFLSNGNGSFTQSGSVPGWGPGGGFIDGNIYPIITGDWNGDGRTDFARVNYEGFVFFLSNGNGSFTQSGSVPGWGPGGGFIDGNIYPIITGDWNGDGKTDFARVNYEGFVFFLSNGNGSFTQSGSVPGWGPSGGFTNGSTYPIITGDWNGDGKTDFARVNGAGIYFFVSNGNGGFTQSGSVPGWGPSGGLIDGNRYPIITGDWNEDGKTDFARVSVSGITFFLSNGDSGYTNVSTVPGWGTAGGYKDNNTFPIIVGDWNGDGKTDFARVSTSGITFFADPALAQGFLGSVTSDLGVVTGLTYASLTNSSFYTKGNSSVYPLLDVQAPLYVVSSVTSSNGLGGTVTTNYKYGGLKAEVGTGRGLLGFNWIESTQVETGVTTRTTNRQDWPYVGLPTEVKKTQSSASGPNKQISLMTATYGCNNPQDGSACAVAAGKRYFPYVSQSEEQSWDLNGAVLPTLTTTNQFDPYGNATQITVGTGDGYSKRTTNTYQNDTTNWYLGRLLRSQVQSTTP